MLKRKLNPNCCSQCTLGKLYENNLNPDPYFCSSLAKRTDPVQRNGSGFAVSRHPHKPRGKGIKVQFDVEVYKPLEDLCLYSVIVFNAGNDSYSLGYCIIDCTSEIRMCFIDRLVPLDFRVLVYVNSIYCLSSRSLFLFFLNAHGLFACLN